MARLAILAIVVIAFLIFGSFFNHFTWRRVFWFAYFVLTASATTAIARHILQRYRICALEMDRALTQIGLQSYNGFADRVTRAWTQWLVLFMGFTCFPALVVLLKQDNVDAPGLVAVALAGGCLSLCGYWAVCALLMPWRVFRHGNVRLELPAPSDAPVIRVLTRLYNSATVFSTLVVLAAYIPVYVGTSSNGSAPDRVLWFIRILLAAISLVILTPLALVPHIAMSRLVFRRRVEGLRSSERIRRRSSHRLLSSRFPTTDLNPWLSEATIRRSSMVSFNWRNVVATFGALFSVAAQIYSLYVSLHPGSAETLRS